MGNMAFAIVQGALSAGAIDPSSIAAYDPKPDKIGLLEEQGLANVRVESLAALAEVSDILVLSIKPHIVEAVVSELGDALAGKAVLSIALGWRYDELERMLPASARWQSIMPNTPMEVGEGVCIFEARGCFSEEEHHFVTSLFRAIGMVEVYPTPLMKAAGTLTGCGPAFTYVYIEALADAAVYHGVPRADAYRLAAQTVLGAAKMVLETGLHPGQLKDNVCSPGGSTIRGIAALEERGFRSTVIDAIRTIEGTK